MGNILCNLLLYYTKSYIPIQNNLDLQTFLTFYYSHNKLCCRLMSFQLNCPISFNNLKIHFSNNTT